MIGFCFLFFVFFFCEEVMREPRVAADGFTYGDGALREWLHDGHETSPVTKLQILSLPTITLSLTTPLV